MATTFPNMGVLCLGWMAVPLLVAGCTTSLKTVTRSAQRVSPCIDDATTASIGRDLLLERVTQALTETTYLSFELQVHAPPSIDVRVESRMALGLLQSKFFVRDTKSQAFKEETPVLVVTARGGSVHEYRLPLGNAPSAEVRYPAPIPGGTNDARLDDGFEGYMCLMASGLYSWLGKRSNNREYLRMAIEQGELRPDQQIDGRAFFVVFWDRQAKIDRQDVFYFDAETYFLCRWDTFYTDLGPRPVLSRTRRFNNMSTAPIPIGAFFCRSKASQ